MGGRGVLGWLSGLFRKAEPAPPPRPPQIIEEPWLAQLRMMPVDDTASDWRPCDGTALQIAGNAALFALVGNAFGGDGVRTFALPDLRPLVPGEVRPPLRADATFLGVDANGLIVSTPATRVADAVLPAPPGATGDLVASICVSGLFPHRD